MNGAEVEFSLTLYAIKKIFLHSKIPLTILGMIIPFVLVSIVYQLRYRLKPASYKMAIMGSFSTIALVPLVMVILHNSPALSIGDCVEDRRRTAEIELKSGKVIEVPLVYKVMSITDGKYEVNGNDKSVLKIKVNRIDLKNSYRKRSNCPGFTNT